MPNTIKRIIIMLSLFSSLAFGEPTVNAESLKAADELAEVIGLKNQMKAGADAMLPLIEEQSRKLNLSLAETAEFKKIYRSWYMEDLDHESLSKQITRLYAETFTIQELKGLTDFYKTPLGKKTLKTLSTLMAKATQMGIDEAKDKEDSLLKRLEPFFEKIKE